MLSFSDYKFELAYKIKEVNQLSKNITKDENNIFIIEKTIDAKNIFSKTVDELFELAKKLDILITENADYEYINIYTNQKEVLKTGFFPILNKKNHSSDTDKLEEYPLAELWKEFYENEIKDFSTLYRLHLLYQPYRKTGKFSDVINDILGIAPTTIINNIAQLFENTSGKNPRANIMAKIIDLLYMEYEEKNKEYIFETAKALTIALLDRKTEDLVEKLSRPSFHYDKKIEYNTFFSIPSKVTFNYLSNYYNEKTFIESFILKLAIENKLSNYKHGEVFYSLIEIANSIELGLAPKELLIKNILSTSIENILDNLKIFYHLISDKKHDFYNDVDKMRETWNYDKAIKVLEKCVLEAVDSIVDSELKSEDSKTKYSKLITYIEKIEGIDYLIKILQALDNKKIARNKKETLNYLLKICYPSEEDNLKTFKEKIKNTDISKERLIEVVIYAPQWKKIIDDFLMS